MSWRTVIVTRRSKLDVSMGYLVIRAEDVKKVFLEDISILVVEDPAISLTGCLLEALTERKIRVVFCDKKHNPYAELAPLCGSHDCLTRVKQQLAWKPDTKKAVWQRIIREKIAKSQEFLEELKKTREADLLLSYLPQVQPGDSTNREGHAAKVYFNALFGMDFTRGNGSPVNAALNYGYSILLSAVNRELTSIDVLTRLGIFHDNSTNRFNLSSDLMEPFRVLIDRAVVDMMPSEFTVEEKRVLWDVLYRDVMIDGAKQTVMNALPIYLRSVIRALNEDAPDEIRFWRSIRTGR